MFFNLRINIFTEKPIVKKVCVMIMFLIVSLSLTACSANPEFGLIDFSTDVVYENDEVNVSTYYVNQEDLSDNQLIVTAFLYADSGGILVSEKAYFEIREDNLFSYQVYFEDELILMKEFDEEKPLTQLEFPVQGTNAPRAMIDIHEEIKIPISSKGNYRVIIKSHTLYEDQWIVRELLATFVIR